MYQYSLFVDVEIFADIKGGLELMAVDEPVCENFGSQLKVSRSTSINGS
jgi:hypothetical protein